MIHSGTLPLITGLLLALLLLPTSLPAADLATEQRNLSVGDLDIPTTVYPGKGDRLLLWLPAEFGNSPRQVPTAQALAAAGTTVWMPNLHEALFIPPGRYSLVGLDTGILRSLIQQAADTGKTVYLMAPGRAAALALIAVREWQADPTRNGTLMGAILMHPKLFVRTPQGGEDPEFLPVASASNIPIYLLQPSNAANYWRLARFRDVLEQGGAPVFVHRLMGVSDGFHRRMDTRPGEPEMTDRLPGLLLQAMKLLDAYGPAPDRPARLASEAVGPELVERKELLTPLTAPIPAPPLALTDLDGNRHDLGSDLRDKAVLINFWATWCPPCVKELPALSRLNQRMQGKPFQVLTVAVGEQPEQVRTFLADKDSRFPVLLDPEGETFTAWQAYAFPTTMILDRRHRIRYAVFGALEWDSDEVVETLQLLLDE
jgi:thiol-disulfide isomerase/thioredoxin